MDHLGEGLEDRSTFKYRAMAALLVSLGIRGIISKQLVSTQPKGYY
jgi:hypothetical protein